MSSTLNLATIPTPENIYSDISKKLRKKLCDFYIDKTPAFNNSKILDFAFILLNIEAFENEKKYVVKLCMT
jgi:hypothetical protein